MSVGASPLGVIPARSQSTRFPKKVLTIIKNKPMIQHVWEAALRSRRLGEVLVATGDVEVADVVENFGGKIVWTKGTFESGTDRVAFVARERTESLIVNLQADEPLLRPDAIDKLIDAMSEPPLFDMATLVVPKQELSELKSSHVVKVVFSQNRRALYFSRHAIGMRPGGGFFKHVGVYAYRREALLRLCDIVPSPLEQEERLEQLRALEHDFSIRVVLMNDDTIAVDTPEDLEKVKLFLEREGR